MTRKKGNKHAPSIKKSALKATTVAAPVVAADPLKAPASMAAKRPAWGKFLSRWLVFFFKRWWSLCVLVGTTAFSNIVTHIQGNPSRFWTFLQQHLLLTIVVILITAMAPFFALRKEKADEQKSQTRGAGGTPQMHGKVSV